MVEVVRGKIPLLVQTCLKNSFIVTLRTPTYLFDPCTPKPIKTTLHLTRFVCNFFAFSSFFCYLVKLENVTENSSGFLLSIYYMVSIFFPIRYDTMRSLRLFDAD